MAKRRTKKKPLEVKITAHTAVPVQYDRQGDDLIVYPCAYTPEALAALQRLVETAGPGILYAMGSAADAGIYVPEKEMGLEATPFTPQDIPVRAVWRARNN